MIDISTFVAKHRKQEKKISIEEEINKLPWYKRPIERDAFITRKAKNGLYYVRHNEWAKTIWIGPYKTLEQTSGIIDSYVEKSLNTTLDKVGSNSGIHSVYVENDKTFF